MPYKEAIDNHSLGTDHLTSRGGVSGADPGFQVRGAHLKKLRRAEEGANILGVFRVKNHYFTPKNHSFYNYGGRRGKFWGISCEKSRFYAKKTYFFPILGGGGARRVRPPPSPPLDPPLGMFFSKKNILIPNVAEKNILILVEEKKMII